MRRKNSRMEAEAQPPIRSSLIDEVRSQIRVRHYSLSTERTYVSWTRFFVLFTGFAIRAKWVRRKSSRF